MRNASDVYLKTASLCLFVATLACALNQVLAGPLPDRSLRWAAVFAVIQTIAFLSAGSYVLGQRLYRRFRTGIHQQISPAIEERVMALALEGGVWPTPVPSHGPARVVLEQCLAHALSGLKDSGQDRLAHFAIESGFAAQWERSALSGTWAERKRALSLLALIARVSGNACVRSALRDKDPAIRLEVARALLIAGEPGAPDQVFRSVLGESRLVRALLCNDLKRHARHLLADVVPSVLAGDDRRAAANCLEMLAAWTLAMPTLEIGASFFASQDACVLPVLLALTPYVPSPVGVEALLSAALENESLAVRCAAAVAIGQLKLPALIPALIWQTQNASGRLATLAAAALAQMGVDGTRKLEGMVAGPDRKAAAAAMEALANLSVRPV